MRRVANLSSYSGYSLILDLVVKPKVEGSLASLRAAKTNFARLEAAREYAVWADVLETLKGLPEKVERELKEGKDV